MLTVVLSHVYFNTKVHKKIPGVVYRGPRVDRLRIFAKKRVSDGGSEIFCPGPIDFKPVSIEPGLKNLHHTPFLDR